MRNRELFILSKILGVKKERIALHLDVTTRQVTNYSHIQRLTPALKQSLNELIMIEVERLPAGKTIIENEWNNAIKAFVRQLYAVKLIDNS